MTPINFLREKGELEISKELLLKLNEFESGVNLKAKYELKE
jgi:hypothetical protein